MQSRRGWVLCGHLSEKDPQLEEPLLLLGVGRVVADRVVVELHLRLELRVAIRVTLPVQSPTAQCLINLMC